MRIAFEEPMHGGGRSGISTAYTRNLLRELIRLAPEHEFTLFGYFFRDYARKLEIARANQAAGLRFFFPRWPESLVGRAEWGLGLPVVEGRLKLKGFDLYHAHRIPRRHWLKTVTTVHDLFPAVHPEWASPYLSTLWEKVLRPGMSRVDRIIAVSEQTKRDLVERWRVPAGSVEVIYQGVNRSVFRPLDGAAAADARERLKVPRRFFLMIGPYDPWSDPSNALRALSRLPKAMADAGILLCGQPGSLEREVRRLIAELGLEDRVRWTGYIPQQDLVALYNLAQALLYPSFYEGFGMPALEAMSCGAPLITSNVSSLPELAGDAGILVDPNSVEQLEDALCRVLEDVALRARMRERGLRRVELFSWEQAALKTLAVYRSVAG